MFKLRLFIFNMYSSGNRFEVVFQLRVICPLHVPFLRALIMKPLHVIRNINLTENEIVFTMRPPFRHIISVRPRASVQ
jgi:hypothetical protein